MKKSYLFFAPVMLWATACSSDNEPKQDADVEVSEQSFVNKVVGQTWIADPASAQVFDSQGVAVTNGKLNEGTLTLDAFRVDDNIYTEYTVAADGSRTVAAFEYEYISEDGFVYVYDVNNILRHKLRILSVNDDELTVAANYGEVEVPDNLAPEINVRHISGYVTYRMHRASASELAALPVGKPGVKAVPKGTYAVSAAEFASKVNGNIWVAPAKYKEILKGDGQAWEGAEAYIIGAPMLTDFRVKGNEISSFFGLTPGQKYEYPEYEDAKLVYSMGRCLYREREGVLYVYTAVGYMEPVLRVEKVDDGVLTVSCRYGLAVKDGKTDPTSRVVYELRQPAADTQADYDNALLFKPHK